MCPMAKRIKQARPVLQPSLRLIERTTTPYKIISRANTWARKSGQVLLYARSASCADHHAIVSAEKVSTRSAMRTTAVSASLERAGADHNQTISTRPKSVADRSMGGKAEIERIPIQAKAAATKSSKRTRRSKPVPKTRRPPCELPAFLQDRSEICKAPAAEKARTR